MKFNFYAVTAFLFLALAARAQTTAFTYQGQLDSNNAPATGPLRFPVSDLQCEHQRRGRAADERAGGRHQRLVHRDVEFWQRGFLTAATRWLEIGVRTNGDTNAYTVLSPRQPMTSRPTRSSPSTRRCSNAVVLTAPLQATNITGVVPATNFRQMWRSSPQPDFHRLEHLQRRGDGKQFREQFYRRVQRQWHGLSNVPAASLTGTLPDARLSANVALQSNPNLNFAGAVSATNFTGGGHGLTNVPGAFFWVTVADQHPDPAQRRLYLQQ